MATYKLPKSIYQGSTLPGVKPTGPVRLDPDHPLSDHLVSANFFLDGTVPGNDLVRGRNSGIEGTATIGADANGRFVELNDDGDSLVVGKGGAIDDMSTLTLIVCAKRLKSAGTGTATQNLMDKSNNDSSGMRWRLTNSGGGSQQFRRDFSSGDVTVYATDINIAVGSTNVFAVTWEGTTSANGVKHYRNGEEITGRITNGNGSGSKINDSGNDLRISGRADGTRTLDGNLYYALIFDIVLSPGQIRSLNDNPYQLLKSSVEQVYFPDIAANGTKTGSGTLVADDVTVSGSGTVTSLPSEAVYSQLPKAFHPDFTRLGVNPTEDVAIDKASHLARGLKALYHAKAGNTSFIDGEGNRIPTSVSSGTIGFVPNGKGMAISALATDTSLMTEGNVSAPGTGDYTLFAYVYLPDLQGTFSYLIAFDTHMGIALNNNDRFYQFQLTGSPTSLVTNNVLAAGEFHTVVSTRRGRIRTIYVDGVEANSADDDIANISDRKLRLLSYNGTFSTNRGRDVMIAGYSNRAWCEAEVAAFGADPYQMLKPAVAPAYFLAPAVPAAVQSPLPKAFHPDFTSPKVKPIGPVQLDTSDPFSRGLVGCWLMNSQRPDIETDLSPTRALVELKNGAVPAIREVGKVIDFSAANAELVRKPIPEPLLITGDLTIVILFKLNNMSAEQYLIGTDSANEGVASGNCIYSLAMQTDGDMKIFYENGTGANHEARSASTGISANEWHIAALTRRAGASNADIDFYMDGELVSTVTGLGNASGGSASPFIIGGLREATTAQLNGAIGFTYVYNRRFTACEHKMINDSPYRMLEPVTPQVLFGAAPLAVHTGSGTLVTDDSTVSGSGTVTSAVITGTGTLTVADSTMSGTGTAGTVHTGTGVLVADDSSLIGVFRHPTGKELNSAYPHYSSITRALSGDRIRNRLADIDGNDSPPLQPKHQSVTNSVSGATFTAVQGIDRDASSWWGFSLAKIERYDLSSNVQATRSSPLVGTGMPGSLNHVGAGFVDGTHAYYTVENAALTEMGLVKVDELTLAFVEYIDLKDTPVLEPSGCCLNKEGTEILISQYDKTPGDLRTFEIHRIDATTFAYIGTHILSDELHGIQDIVYHDTDDMYYLTTFPASAANGRVVAVLPETFEVMSQIDPLSVSTELEGVCSFGGELFFHAVNGSPRLIENDTVNVAKSVSSGDPIPFLSNALVADTGTILMRVSAVTLFANASLVDNDTLSSDWEAWVDANGTLNWRVDSASSLATAAGTIVAEQEYIIALTWSNSAGTVTTDIGVDGTYVGSTTGTWVTPPTNGLGLAGVNGSNTQGNNVYRDVLVFDKALSADELLDASDNFGAIYVALNESKGNGTLVTDNSTMSGSGTVTGNITGTGTLTVTDSTMAGAGERVVTGSGTLSVTDSAIAANVDIIHVGSGALTVTDSTVSGSGTVTGIGTGTGALVASDATVSGVGTRIVTATGTLTVSDSTVSGLGTITRKGTGSLVADDVTLAGAGTRIITGSGTLTVTDSTVAGSGAIEGAVTGTGALTVSDSAVAGVGVITRKGNGSLVAEDSTVSGSGGVAGNITGTGTLVADDATITATVDILHTGSGTLAVTDSTVIGSGTSVGGSTGTGTLTVTDSAVAGVGVITRKGTGSLIADDATLIGSGVRVIVGSGVLLSSDSLVVGAQSPDVTTPARRRGSVAARLNVGQVPASPSRRGSVPLNIRINGPED